jgi:hypothetical protein
MKKKPDLKVVPKVPVQEREFVFTLKIDPEIVFENDEMRLMRFQSTIHGEVMRPSYHIWPKIDLADKKD